MADWITPPRRWSHRRQAKSKSYEAARKKLEELVAEPKLATPEVPPPPLAKWAGRWLQTPKVERLKPRTQAEYARDPYLTRYLLGLVTGGRQGEVLGGRIECLNFTLNEAVEPVGLGIEFAWALQQLPFDQDCGSVADDNGVALQEKRAGYCSKRRTSIPDNQEFEQAYEGLWLLRPRSDS